MIHFCTDYVSTNPDVIRCRDIARRTWKELQWQERPIKDSDLPRLYKADGKSLPFMKDVFDLGVKDAADREICVFTNDDIQIHFSTPYAIAARLQETDACYCFRRDFPPGRTEPVPYKDYISGHDYPGSDLYAFRAGWWRRVRGQMPDMILANEAWDAVLRCLIDMTNRGKQTGMKDLIAHEKNGASWWERPENRYTLHGQKHNLTQAYHWFRKHGYEPRTFGVRLPT